MVVRAGKDSMNTNSAIRESGVERRMIAETNKEKVRAFLLRFIHKPDLCDDEDIFALGFVNSLFAMQLVLFVESEFNITVENDDLEIENFNSVNAITGLIERKMSPPVVA